MKLKQCPFCGSKAKLITRELGCCYTPEEDKRYDVGCTNGKCYLEDGANRHFSSKDEAIEIWNRRKKDN